MIIEVTDGDSPNYRGNLFYDLVKSSVIRLAYGMSEELKDKETKLEIPIPNGPRLGNNVIDPNHVMKAIGDKLLYEGLSFKVTKNRPHASGA